MIDEEEIVFFGYSNEKMYIKGFCKEFTELEDCIDEERIIAVDKWGEPIVFKFVRLVTVQFVLGGIIYVAEYELKDE